MAEGRSNHGIASKLVVTEHAVEKHIRSIFRGCRSTVARKTTGVSSPS